MVPMSTQVSDDEKAEPEFVMVELSGSFDPDNVILKRARKLVHERGSREMLESFDSALVSGTFLPKMAED